MVFMPQSGYIHPDEFFQSVEVVTGDVLSTDTVRTWDFNVTAPIRSVTLPHILFGSPLQVTRFGEISPFWENIYPQACPDEILVLFKDLGQLFGVFFFKNKSGHHGGDLRRETRFEIFRSCYLICKKNWRRFREKKLDQI
jgi:hypothetical protein